MPTFFIKDKLTEIERKNWDKAINDYQEVFNINLMNEYKNMSESEIKRFMKDLKIKSYSEKDVLNELKILINLGGNQPGHEKSALFYRLLEGKKPFKLVPPKSYSYPDYEIIESNGEREIMFLDKDNINDLIEKKDKYINYKHININQYSWKVIKVISKNEVHISLPEWEELGFVWELKFKEISAKESRSAILSHHNDLLDKITNYNDLLKECIFQVKNKYHQIIINLDKNEYKRSLEENINKYAGFGKSIVEQNLINGKLLLEERRNRNLADYPSDEDILKEAEERVPNYLRSDYFIKENGDLYKRCWIMRLIKEAENKEEIYMNI